MIRRLAVAGFAALVVLAIAATPALAHVEVQPAEAAAGQPATFSFRVPNEQDGAATVSLVVHVPPGRPLPGLAAPPKAGWTIAVTPDTVTWSGGRIEPGHAEYFTLTTGPLPTDVDALVFAADQTYSNGDVVSWNEPEVAGGAEPVHPAPVLKLTGASPAPATTTPAPATTTHAVALTSTPSDEGGGAPVGLIVGVSAAAVAIVAIAAVAWLRVPRRRSVHR